MTREDVKKIMPEATEEQITAFLNQYNADVKKSGLADKDLEDLRSKAKKYDDYETEKLTIEEKTQKALDEAEQMRIENLKMLNRTKALAEFTKAGITEDDCKELLSSIVTDDEAKTIANAQSFVNLLSSKTKAYQEQLKDTQLKNIIKPKNNGGTLENEKTEAEKIALQIATNSAESTKASSESLKYYTGG